MQKQLKGMRVVLTVSDPWEFGTAHGTGPFFAAIIGVDMTGDYGDIGKRLLLRLATVIVFEGTSCEYLVAQPRFRGDTLLALPEKPVNCNLTAISAERAVSSSPLDLSWWRGGVVLIATVAAA